ncbi:hypothetical protein [Pedobacter aquatilis]|uniref:hypothetical protein n=1 Tax=Pedobacter aquatilis TaxID=351343 RepID=UPI00292E2E1F|nr:hypothetical protein [Pedobacter aquatilis]
MKTSLFIGLLILLTKLSFGQQVKQNIDYQYYRDDKSYYAFELFRNIADDKAIVNLNFTTNTAFKKIDKIYITNGVKEVKLKFKTRSDVVESDNPELKFHAISLNIKDLANKEIDCEAKIVFKLDNGLIYTLPFSRCNLDEQLTQLTKF